MAPRKNKDGSKKGKSKAPKTDKKLVVPKQPEVQDSSTSPDNSEESCEGEEVTEKASKVTVAKKPRKEKDIAVTRILQIRENQDMLAEWIKTHECMYNLDDPAHLDTTAKMKLYDQKAKDMMKENPKLGEVTGKYHDCVEFC